MAKRIILENNAYQVTENYKEGFDQAEIEKKYTDYFKDYDYIMGDWSYGKLRLKGFCEKSNPLYKPINGVAMKEDYLKKQCAYDCRYFILKKE